MNALRLKVLMLFLFMMGVEGAIYSQFNFVYNDSIVVIHDADTLPVAWAGGMSHPQFSTIDLDFDGVEELVAFELENGIVNVFKRQLHEGNVVYSYWHNGSSLFPKGLRYRMKLVDFNGDGKKDIFTYTLGGIKVYKNISNSTDGVQWELYKDPIKSVVNNNLVSLYVSSNDIPAYVDVDGDGDIDVLAFNVSFSRVEWHKNLSVENYGHADSLIFELEQPCWGDFVESPTGNTIELNSTMSPCGTTLNKAGGAERHSGGSILALDANASGLMDLIIGDIDFNNLTLLINGGSSPHDNALMVSYDANFPSDDVPLDLSNFLTAYYEDFDLDGVNDLIVSTTVSGTSDNTKGVWLYKNNGMNNHPDFQFTREDFLQGDMIQNGKGAIPIFVDVNNDGLTDLLVANQFNYREALSSSSRMNYYMNVGSASEPTFKLINENWNNFGNSGYSGRVSPAFADLDGDGDQDMIVGIANGRLYYYENSGGSAPMNFNIAQYQLLDNNGDPIVVSNNATPELFDLDNDGLVDLVIGQGNGPLIYYKNIGTTTSYSFELINSNLGQVDLTSSEYMQTFGVPRFVRNNDTTYLFAGNRTGTISFYDGVDGQLAPGDAFNLVSSKFLNIDTRGMSAPAIGQLRNDNSYDFFVGTEVGGLWSYRPGDTTYLNVNNEQIQPALKLLIYPNPTRGEFVIAFEELNGERYNFRVLDPLGREITAQNNLSQSEVFVQLENPTSGIYFVELTLIQSQKRVVRRVVVK